MLAEKLNSGSGGPVTYIEDVFSTYLYTGNGSTQTINNGIDLAGKGGLVWIKSRSAATDHKLTDTVRGATKALISNTTGAQTTDVNGLTSFGSTGFSIGTDSVYNTSAATYASWTFREQPKFFDVVTWTGDGAGERYISHDLQSSPGCIIMKCTSSSGDWFVWHIGNGGGVGSASPNVFGLNSTNSAQYVNSYGTMGNSSIFYPTSPGSGFNNSGQTYVAYLFANNTVSDPGNFGETGTDNVISCGSYTGDGSTNIEVNLGWEPQWILTRPINFAAHWIIGDVMRGMSVDGGARLFPNLANAEVSSPIVRPTATGFITNTGVPSSGSTYIYIAIRRGPMKVPTDATKVYLASTSSYAAAATVTVGFPPDLSVLANRGGSADKRWEDNLRGYQRTTSVGFPSLASNSATAEDTAVPILYNRTNTTVQVPTFWSGGTPGLVMWNFQRAPSFFDEVCYTGTGSFQNISHNLTVVPELILVKARSTTSNWGVGVSTGGGEGIVLASAAGNFDLNTNGGTIQSISWDGYIATSTYVRNDVIGAGFESYYSSGVTYVMYLFASCPGVSKVGSYTGTGATQTISCGFTGGARFVLIKRTDSTGNWGVLDTARGMVAGTDPYLNLNTTAAEVNANNVYTATGGFQLVSSDANFNASGGTYIFLAIA